MPDLTGPGTVGWSMLQACHLAGGQVCCTGGRGAGPGWVGLVTLIAVTDQGQVLIQREISSRYLLPVD